MYFARLEKMIAASVDTVAAECFEQLILDVGGLPARPDKTARMIMEIEERTKRLGVELRLVGPDEAKKGLSALAETAGMAVFSSVTEARASKGS
jgi:two-component system cell cycle response regulator